MSDELLLLFREKTDTFDKPTKRKPQKTLEF